MSGKTSDPVTTGVPSVPSADRRTFLGASDIAAVLGLSPYTTPGDVWSEKTSSEPKPQLDNDDVARGLAMEPVIDHMVRRRGVVLEAGGEFQIVGSCVVVHPDRLAPDGVWELKAPRRWSKAWGEEGTDEVPEQYLVQIMVQMLAVRAAGRSVDSSHIAAMCGELRTYPIAFNLDTARSIVDYADGWWNRHVKAGVEPPAHSVVELNQIVKRKPSMVVPVELAHEVQRLKLFRKVEAKAKALADEAKRKIMAAVAIDGLLPESISGPDGDEIATTRRGGRMQLDTEALRADFPTIVETYMKRIEWNELRPSKKLDVLVAPAEIAALATED